MKTIFTLLILILFLTTCRKKDTDNDKIIEKGIEENFEIKGFNQGVDIYFKPDFTFIKKDYSFGCTGGFRIIEYLGTYEKDSNHIRLNPKQIIWKEDWEEFYDEEKFKFDTIQYYTSDSTLINRNYWVIPYSNVKLLIANIEKNDFLSKSTIYDLANIYNSKSQKVHRDEIFITKDKKLPVLNKSLLKQIPQKFKSIFYDSIQEYRVLNIKVNKELIPLYGLKIESDQTPYIGLYLYDKNNRQYEVKSINSKNIIAEGESLFYTNGKLRKGDVLKTTLK